MEVVDDLGACQFVDAGGSWRGGVTELGSGRPDVYALSLRSPTMPLPLRGPRVTVATGSVDTVALRRLGEWCAALHQLLPHESLVEIMRGVSGGRADSGLQDEFLEAWWEEHRPDLLYFPSIADIGVGIQAITLMQARRIKPASVLVNAISGLRGVRERLLARNLMLAAGSCWPGDATLAACSMSLPRGVSWLVDSDLAGRELWRYKPRLSNGPQLVRTSVSGGGIRLEMEVSLLLGGAGAGFSGARIPQLVMDSNHRFTEKENSH